VDRRLAAILAADVVGYSRLMGADEEGTLVALRAIRRELTTKVVISKWRIGMMFMLFSSHTSAGRECRVQTLQLSILRTTPADVQRRQLSQCAWSSHLNATTPRAAQNSGTWRGSRLASLMLRRPSTHARLCAANPFRRDCTLCS
jgi:hypothetical protein